MEEKLERISNYLSNKRDTGVVQYSHFVKGVYIVQVEPSSRFSFMFWNHMDEHKIYGVYLNRITDFVYTIVVKE